MSEEIESDVTINLLQGGAATYGTTDDWNLSVGGTDCPDASQNNPCVVTIADGDRSATATVNVNTDTDIESTPEIFTISVVIASPDSTVVTGAGPSTLNFTINDVPPPTVSMNYSGTTTLSEPVGVSTQSGTAWITIELSRALTEEVMVNIVAGGSSASYGDGGSGNDWQVRVQPVSADGVPDTTSSLPHNTACATATGSNCQATFTTGVTIVQVEVTVFADLNTEGEESFTLSINIASAGSTGLINGSTSPLMFTIPANST